MNEENETPNPADEVEEPQAWTAVRRKSIIIGIVIIFGVVGFLTYFSSKQQPKYPKFPPGTDSTNDAPGPGSSTPAGKPVGSLYHIAF